VSLRPVKVDEWFRIIFELKASLTVSFAAVQRQVLSSCLEGGGEAFQKKIGELFYAITVTGQRPSAGDGREEMNRLTLWLNTSAPSSERTGTTTARAIGTLLPPIPGQRTATVRFRFR